MTACRPRFPNPGKVAAGAVKTVNGRKVIVDGSAIAAGKHDTMILPKWACGVLASPDKPVASGHARGKLTWRVQHGSVDQDGVMDAGEPGQSACLPRKARQAAEWCYA